MITSYKYKSDIPYSLHDQRICKIEKIEDSLKIHFENGYVECKEPYRQVNGDITIEKVDFDFCFAYLLNYNGNFEKFNGEKMELLDFLEQYKNFSFEVVDETYGYNTVVYNGYLSIPKKNNLNELTITIYHFGNIVYETKD